MQTSRFLRNLEASRTGFLKSLTLAIGGIAKSYNSYRNVEIMKCAILAAGKGTRMLPLTENVPKPLVEVNGRPFLYYVLENLNKAGFDDIAIIIGHRGEMIKDWALEAGEEITFIEQKEQRGTGDAIGLLRDWSGEDDFVVLMGDNLYSPKDLKKLKEGEGFHYISAIKGDSRAFGELEVEGGFLVKIREKPEEVISGLINTGAYKFTKEIYGAIGNLEVSERGEYEITDALTELAGKGRVKVLGFEDYWVNFGSIEDFKSVEEFVRGEFSKA